MTEKKYPNPSPEEVNLTLQKVKETTRARDISKYYEKHSPARSEVKSQPSPDAFQAQTEEKNRINDYLHFLETIAETENQIPNIEQELTTYEKMSAELAIYIDSIKTKKSKSREEKNITTIDQRIQALDNYQLHELENSTSVFQELRTLYKLSGKNLDAFIISFRRHYPLSYLAKSIESIDKEISHLRSQATTTHSEPNVKKSKIVLLLTLQDKIRDLFKLFNASIWNRNFDPDKKMEEKYFSEERYARNKHAIYETNSSKTTNR